jgi:hypothetical protein
MQLPDPGLSARGRWNYGLESKSLDQSFLVLFFKKELLSSTQDK